MHIWVKPKEKKSGSLSLKVVKMKRKRESEGENKFERDVSNERCYKNFGQKINLCLFNFIFKYIDWYIEKPQWRFFVSVLGGANTKMDERTYEELTNKRIFP